MEETITELLNRIERAVYYADKAGSPVTITTENLRSVLDHISGLTTIINNLDEANKQSDTIYRSSEKVMSFSRHAFKNILISLDRRCWSCDYAFQMQDWINTVTVYSGKTRILCNNCCTHLIV